MYKLNTVGGKQLFLAPAAKTVDSTLLAAIDSSTSSPTLTPYAENASTEFYNAEHYCINDEATVVVADNNVCLGVLLTNKYQQQRVRNFFQNFIANVVLWTDQTKVAVYPVYGVPDTAITPGSTTVPNLTQYEILPHKIYRSGNVINMQVNTEIITMPDGEMLNSRNDESLESFFGVVIANPGATNAAVWGRLFLQAYRYEKGISLSSPWGQ